MKRKYGVAHQYQLPQKILVRNLPRGPGGYRIYYLLAAFDVLTVLVSLYILARVMGTYAGSVEVNREWTKRESMYEELGRLAGTVAAPGDDVFGCWPREHLHDPSPSPFASEVSQPPAKDRCLKNGAGAMATPCRWRGACERRDPPKGFPTYHSGIYPMACPLDLTVEITTNSPKASRTPRLWVMAGWR